MQMAEKFDIEIIVANGKPGKKEVLPQELQLREELNDRKNREEIVEERS